MQAPQGTLAERLRAWPPSDVEWVTDDLRRRWARGLEASPRDEVMRLGLSLARLDLLVACDSGPVHLASAQGRPRSPAARASSLSASS